MPATRAPASSLLPRPRRGDAPERVVRAVESFDAAVVRLVSPVALPALRILLGAVFIWFGALKVTGNSPVAAMVAGTLPFANADLVVPVLGAVEVLLGLALVTGLGLRVALPALVAHLGGTFLTFVMLPGQMFRDSDPLLLTQSGEFVAKNLVLVCAGLVLIAHGRHRGPARGLAQA
jgi:putative oxidoreductase